MPSVARNRLRQKSSCSTRWTVCETSMASRLQIESEVRPLDVKAATKLSERSSLLSSSKDAAPSKELARLKVRRAQSLGGATHDVAQLRSATLEEVVSMNP